MIPGHFVGQQWEVRKRLLDPNGEEAMRHVGLLLAGTLALATPASVFAGFCDGRSSDFRDGAVAGLTANGTPAHLSNSTLRTNGPMGYEYGKSLLDNLVRLQKGDAIDQAVVDCGGSRSDSNGQGCVEAYETSRKSACARQAEITPSGDSLQLQHCRHLGFVDGSTNGKCASTAGGNNTGP
jgi:hypothetical protein